MSFFSGTIFSRSLNMDTNIGVILPQDSRKCRNVEPSKQGISVLDIPRTLILLHGLSDNASVWSSRTSILRYAEEYNIAVIMPEVQRSFYLNMKNGPNYYDYIVNELPELISKMFKVSVIPNDLSIAGISMGGFGALLLGLSNSERFYGIGAFSAVINLKSLVFNEEFVSRKELTGWEKDSKGIFGEELVIPKEVDLYHLADCVNRKRKKPRIIMACGIEDFLHEQNLAFRDHLRKLDFDFRYEEWPGIHEWGFWDKAVQLMLEQFYLTKNRSEI